MGVILVSRRRSSIAPRRGALRARAALFGGCLGAMPGKPLPNGDAGPSLYCAVIVKRVDGQTRAETSINELLRD